MISGILKRVWFKSVGNAGRSQDADAPISARPVGMSPPTLLFCVGAQKAGTTWLHAYLSRHPECSLPLIKELHYFDMRFEQRLANNLGTFRQHSRSLRRDITNVKEAERARTLAFAAECEEFGNLGGVEANDLGPYREFLLRKAADKPLTADITPAYSTLTVPHLKEMATLLPDVRFIYILRDPVDRLWSACKMAAKATSTATDDISEAALESFRRQASKHVPDVLPRGKDQQCLHGDYRTATSRLEKAVSADRLLMVYYEDLFAPETLVRLCNFLEIRPAPPLEEVIFKGESLELPLEDARYGVKCLEDQYVFAQERFGRLPERWIQRRELLQ